MINVGVFINNSPQSRGGGYVLNKDLLNSFMKYNFNDVNFLFLTFNQNSLSKSLTNTSNIIIYKFNLLVFLNSILNSIACLSLLPNLLILFKLFFSFKFNNLFSFILKLSKYDELKAQCFEKQVQHKIHFLLFLEPSDVFSNKLPYFLVNFDFAHFENPFFPEIFQINSFNNNREMKLKSTRRAFKIFNGTNTLLNQVHYHAQIPKDRLSILPFPTPSDAIFYQSKRIDFSDDLPPILNDIKYNYLFYPANFWPHKNHKILLDALIILKSMGIHYKLVFTGLDKGNLPFLESTISQKNMDKDVIMLGFVSRYNLFSIYKHAKALVFPTLIGPDNLPPLEAFALKCPVIASKINGAIEQLGNAAWLFDPFDPKDLCKAIISLNEQKIFWENKVNKAHERALSWTSYDYVNQIEKEIISSTKYFTTYTLIKK